MKIETEGQVDIFKNIIEYRPWGHFGLYADNEECTVKILYVKKGESLSLQMHMMRSQFYYILDHDFLIEYSKTIPPQRLIEDKEGLRQWAIDNLITMPALEGDMYGFKKGILHRATYQGDRDIGRIFEIAFGHNSEQDIIRVEDKYGRK